MWAFPRVQVDCCCAHLRSSGPECQDFLPCHARCRRLIGALWVGVADCWVVMRTPVVDMSVGDVDEMDRRTHSGTIVGHIQFVKARPSWDELELELSARGK